MFQNKKAEMTLPEFMKIVLGVLSISLLLLLAASVYGIFSKKSEIEQARATLDSIINSAKNLNEGEIGNLIIESPKEWFIATFWEGDDLPKDCKDEKCICICRMDDSQISLGDLVKQRKQLCDILSYCINPDKSFDAVNSAQSIKFVELPIMLSILNGKKSFAVGTEEEINSYSDDEKYFNLLLEKKVSVSLDGTQKEIGFGDAILIYEKNGRPAEIFKSLQLALDSFSKEQNILSRVYLHDGKGNNKIFIKNLPVLVGTPNFIGPLIVKWDTIEKEGVKVNLGYSFNKLKTS